MYYLSFTSRVLQISKFRTAYHHPYLLPYYRQDVTRRLQFSHVHCLSLLASFCIWVLERYLYLIMLKNGDPPQRSIPMADYAVTEKVAQIRSDTVLKNDCLSNHGPPT